MPCRNFRMPCRNCRSPPARPSGRLTLTSCEGPQWGHVDFGLRPTRAGVGADAAPLRHDRAPAARRRRPGQRLPLLLARAVARPQPPRGAQRPRLHARPGASHPRRAGQCRRTARHAPPATGGARGRGPRGQHPADHGRIEPAGGNENLAQIGKAHLLRSEGRHRDATRKVLHVHPSILRRAAGLRAGNARTGRRGHWPGC